MRELLTVLFCLFLVPSAFAQKAGFSFFSVETKPGESLRLSDIDSDVKIDGPFAETTVDLGYANNSYSAIQGLFKIELPHGSVIRDFALRLGDKWQYGTLTEKHKARQTFEEIVRAGADPAVLAWKDGADYQVRIFPFPAKGKRFIRLRYWQDLRELKDKFVYSLPLPAGTKLDHFHLKLNIHSRSLDNIQINEHFKDLTYLKAAAGEKESFGAIIDEKQFTVPGEFRLQASASAKQKEIWSGRASPHGDMNYLGARLLADLPETERTLPKSLLVFLDTSRSAKPDHPAQVTAALKALLARLPKSTQVSYFEFDASVRKVEKLDTEHAVYDGGTDFQAVLSEIAKQTKEKPADVLLLSDALPTMQRESALTENQLSNAKIFVLPVKQKFNPHFASLLTERTGGRVLPLPESANTEAIVRAFISAPWRFERIALDAGQASDIYPEPGTMIASEEGLGVYFRTKNRSLSAKATLVVSSGSTQREFKFNLADAAHVPEVENLWAMKKLENLVPQADEFEKELVAHAQRYQFVSPFTSYIVLENDWDYQRFNITKRTENSAGSAGQAEPPMMDMMAAESAAAPPPPAAAPRVAAAGSGGAPMMAKRRAMSAPASGGAPAAEMVLREERRVFVSQPANMPGLDGAAPVARQSLRYTGDKKGLDQLYAEKNTNEMKDAWFFIEFARAFAARGEKQKALRVLSNLFEISEEDGRALRALGLLGCFEGNCEWSQQAFRLAIELRPEEPQNYRDLAWLYAEQGRIKDAQAILAQVKTSELHRRFPGMDQIIARESAMLERLGRGETPSGNGTYAWITWNNDNSDVDFYIREGKEHVVWYGNRQGRGELSFDFTQGYGPEIYTANPEAPKPQFFVHYCRPDQTSADQALVVKFAVIEKMKNGSVKIRSEVFPLAQPYQYVGI